MAARTPKHARVAGGAGTLVIRLVPHAASPAAEPASATHLLSGTSAFFQDPDDFASLDDDVFTPLTRGRSARQALRVWVPGCSTGEEAYSIAIAYSEFCAHTGCEVPLHIVGTDARDTCVEAARRGVYSGSSLQYVSGTRRDGYFSAVSGRWRVVRRLRDCCTFLQHDVLTAPALSGADLVSFRHGLGHVRREERGAVLARLNAALRAGGVLWLGSADHSDSPRAGTPQVPSRFRSA